MKYHFTVVLLLVLLLITACKKEETSQPCDGNGIITFNNKTDSTVLVQIVEAHNTFTLQKNFIRIATVKGNQSYTLVVEGRNYDKDTSLSIHNCETKYFTFSR